MVLSDSFALVTYHIVCSSVCIRYRQGIQPLSEAADQETNPQDKHGSHQVHSYQPNPTLQNLHGPLAISASVFGSLGDSHNFTKHFTRQAISGYYHIKFSCVWVLSMLAGVIPWIFHMKILCILTCRGWHVAFGLVQVSSVSTCPLDWPQMVSTFHCRIGDGYQYLVYEYGLLPNFRDF